MFKLRSLALGALLALAFPLAAFAQCSGNAPLLSFCGNATGTAALPGWKPLTSIPITINSTPISGGTSGGILFNNAGVISNTNSTGSANLLTSGTLTVAIPAGTLTTGVPSRALNTSISITGGPYTGAIYSNLHSGVANSVFRGNGLPGSPTGANWILTQFSASVGAGYDTQDSIGAQVVGQAFAVSAGMVTNAANNTKSDLVGGSFGYANWFNMPNSRGYGITAAATVAENPNVLGTYGTTPTLIAGEFASSIVAGGTVTDRIGVNVLSYWTGVASRINTAMSVQRGNPGGEFSQVITLNPYADGATAPNVLNTTTGDVVYVPTAQTFRSFINAPNATVTWVYNTPNAILTGPGILSLGSATSAGGVTIIGAAGSALNTTYQYAAAPKWTVGGSSALYFFTAVGGARNAIEILNSTNIPTMPSGLISGTAGAVTGSISLLGSTSGTAIITAQNTAGTPTVTLGTGSGTPAVTATAPLAISAATGNITCTGCLTNTPSALTKTDDTNVTLTLGGSPTVALLAATSITVGWTGTLANARLATMATNTVKGNATSGAASPTDLAVGSCSTAASALIWTTNTGFGCNTAVAAAVLTISDDNALAATVYPTWVASTSGNIAQKVSSTKLQFSPSTGNLASTTYNGLTVTANATNTLNIAAGKSLITASDFTTAGAFAITLTATAITSVTLPTAGTLATLAGVESLSSKTLASPALTGTVTGNNTIPLTILAQSAANTMLGNWSGSTANVAANAMPSCSDTTGNHLNYVSGTGITCGTTVGAAAAGTLTGATLAAGVTASSLTSLGTLVANLTISKSNPVFSINKSASGEDAVMTGQKGGLNRWLFNLANNTAEAGSNVGSDFDINRYDDAGTFSGKALTIQRSTGNATFANAMTISGLPTSAGAGGINVCIDTSGVLYKKASCP